MACRVLKGTGNTSSLLLSYSYMEKLHKEAPELVKSLTSAQLLMITLVSLSTYVRVNPASTRLENSHLTSNLYFIISRLFFFSFNFFRFSKQVFCCVNFWCSKEVGSLEHLNYYLNCSSSLKNVVWSSFLKINVFYTHELL